MTEPVRNGVRHVPDACLTRFSQRSIPTRAGIGLRAPHHGEFLATRPPIAWVEVHSENFFAAGGAPPRVLERVRCDYALSLHGVGLALGSTDPIDRSHLAKLCDLVRRVEPALVSEHLCWGAFGGRHLNDLLPLPYTEEALLHLIARVEHVQDALGRPILIENVSSYLEFTDSTIPEWEFLVAVARASGCGILLDVNNVYVSARNHGFDARRYIDAIPAELVGEIHLAGHSTDSYDGCEIVIDTHGAPVADEVWTLFEHALRRIGPAPTLIEWDTELPQLSDLLNEARLAQHRLERANALAA